jgi:hypothetical protein
MTAAFTAIAPKGSRRDREWCFAIAGKAMFSNARR